jgi:integral membrane protein (TIGR01906 family)
VIARVATIALSVAVTLVVPFILVVNCIRMATDEQFVRTVYDYGWVPEDRYGFTEQERERLALLGLRSIEPSTEEGVGLLREARLATGEPAFDARELSHMQDVRTAVSRAYRFQIIALIAIAVLAILFAMLRTTRALIPVALARGAVLTVVLAVAVGLLAVASYDTFETTFHWPFFEGETWRFEETDTLRRLYPDRFWLDVAVAIGVVAAVQAAILFLIAKFWARHAGVRRPLHMQARTEGT